MGQDEAHRWILEGVGGAPLADPLPLRFRTGQRRAFGDKLCRHRSRRRPFRAVGIGRHLPSAAGYPAAHKFTARCGVNAAEITRKDRSMTANSLPGHQGSIDRHCGGARSSLKGALKKFHKNVVAEGNP